MDTMTRRWTLFVVGLVLTGYSQVQSAKGFTDPLNSVSVISAPSVPQPTKPADIVGLIITNAGAPLSARAITFGQVFVAGQIPAGMTVAALVAGQVVPTQMDIKTTNPDGSVRMGIVTIEPPNLAEGPNPVILSRVPVARLVPPLDLRKSYLHGVTVDLAIEGKTPFHLDAASLLANALRDGTASYWLRGPLVTEVRVDAAIKDSLHVTFDIRSYHDGSTVTDIAFRNDYSFEPTGGAINYDVTVKLMDKIALAEKAIRQPQYTQWHKRIWSANIPKTNVVHDIAALERSGAILDYDLRAGVATSLVRDEERSMNGPGFGILGNAGVTMYMGTPGGRGDIGPTTMANAAWILTQDSRAATFALAQADAAGSIPWHFFDRKLGNYRTVTGFPDLWEDPRGGTTGKTTGLSQPVAPYSQSCDCWAPDQAHQPDLSFVPYIFTGIRYYLDQLEAQASWDVLSWNPSYRLGARGIVVFPNTQVRGKAWDLRGIINAAWIIPDDDPLKRYFEKIQRNNFEFLIEETSRLNEGEATGWIPGVYGDNNGAMAPWQQDYFAAVIILAAKRGVPHALDLLKWETNFLAGRFLADSKGFYAYDGAAYNLYLYAPLWGPYRTWASIAQATAAHGQSGGGTNWPKGTFVPYLQAARCVLAEIISLTGSPQAREAYKWLVDHSSQAGGQRTLQDPTWSVVPKALQ